MASAAAMLTERSSPQGTEGVIFLALPPPQPAWRPHLQPT